MSRSNYESLCTILDVHIVMVIAISDTFQAPPRAILELHWDLPPVTHIREPRERGSSIGCVYFESIEGGPGAESTSSEHFPESDPLSHSFVLVNCLSELEGEGWIGVHGRGLNEWLELITWMGGSSLESNYTLNWLFSEDGVAESVSNMWELLIFSPFNIILRSFIVIIMMSLRSVLEGFLMVQLLSLGEPGSGWLSPSVVELKEHVVQVRIGVFQVRNLVELRRNITHLVEVLWSDLRDVQIDHMTVVSVDLVEFVFREVLSVQIVLDVDVFVR